MKTIVALLCSVLMTSIVVAHELPGKSFANFSKPVRKDLQKNIKQYLKRKHDCSKLNVQDTRNVRTEGDILVDAKGRLFGGVLSEEWDIVACGKTVTLLLVIAPDGSGGTLVAIAEKTALNGGAARAR